MFSSVAIAGMVIGISIAILGFIISMIKMKGHWNEEEGLKRVSNTITNFSVVGAAIMIFFLLISPPK